MAITAVCGGCHNTSAAIEDTDAREIVEEVAANTDVSYETNESERDIIRATNGFSFRLFQSVAANSKGKDILISPLGVVYSLVTQQSEAKKILDTWKKEANRDAIKDVSIDIDENTRACLVNTLLFNASWAQMFYKTKKDKFYKTPKDVLTVDMMCNTEKEHYYKYMQNSQYQMLRLPYVGSFYMDVILPNKNITIDRLMAHLDFKQYEESTQKLNTYDIVEVGLPKFHVKSELNLLQLLSDIGFSDLFSMNADYSLMSDSSLYINRMRQDIEMDIDEKGTHIEAVTSTSFAT